MTGPPTRFLPGLLVAVALVVGWRTLASTRQVLHVGKAGDITPAKQAILDQEAAERKLLSRVATEDSLLKDLQGGRIPDPFHPSPPAPPPHRDGTQPPVIVATIPQPSVVMAIVEPARQEVILRIGAAESPRLRKGSSWRGWSIVRIDRDVVEIENQDHEKAYIPVPNLKR